jgi:aryl-alcohol dehydrogenase-like predicted oxidoreductase
MVFGPIRSEKEAHAMLDKALELGINFVDTANMYGSKRFEGEAEKIIGNWLAQDGARREQIVLTTKVFGPMGHGVNDRGLSAYHIRQACEDSLRRLKTDHIDLYFMHHIDRGEPTPADKESWGLPDRQIYRPPHLKKQTPWEEIWQAMELLVQQGKVLYVGSSNFAAWNIVQACEKAAARSFLGLTCEQSVYNLNNRTVELEVIPACREYGLGFLAWSPLAVGLLAGKLPEGEIGRRCHLGETIETHHDKLVAYETLCKELGEKPADVALAWLLHNPVLAAPIIGPRTLEQLASSPRAFEIHLDDELMRRLDEIWPGPGGEAPEAYAW